MRRDPVQPRKCQRQVVALFVGKVGQQQVDIHWGIVFGGDLLEQTFSLQVVARIDEKPRYRELEGDGVRSLAHVFQCLFRLIHAQGKVDEPQQHILRRKIEFKQLFV